MTATTTFSGPATTATGQSTQKSGSAKQIWRSGAVAGLGASAATSTTAAAARAAGVSLRVSGNVIPVIGFAQLTVVAAIIGSVLAVVLSRRATRPRHTFVATTIALTAASIVPDILADAHTATRFTLALTHVVAAAIVIPALARRLRPTN
jgi:peptidoglycan/LPS O-acetylase OafA/YrhL